MQDKGDVVGHGTLPEIKACLMHPEEVAAEVFFAMRDGFSKVAYGLCRNCVLNANAFMGYQQQIEDEINTTAA